MKQEKMDAAKATLAILLSIFPDAQVSVVSRESDDRYVKLQGVIAHAKGIPLSVALLTHAGYVKKESEDVIVLHRPNLDICDVNITIDKKRNIVKFTIGV